jgi:hypothetical protein
VIGVIVRNHDGVDFAGIDPEMLHRGKGRRPAIEQDTVGVVFNQDACLVATATAEGIATA